MIKQILTVTALMYVVIFFSGCTAGLSDPEIDFEPPAYVEQMPAMEDQQDFISTGSIFGQGENPLFSDHKAMHVNDIVRVVISENATSSNVAAKSLSKDSSTDLNTGLISTGANTSSTLSKYANKLNRLGNIGFNAGSNSTFDGSGSATKDASFTTTVSARIVKILQNGNYFIAGKRELLIDKQKQIIQISGVIRPYDIDQFNKIDSAQMSEAKISYKTQGDIDQSTQQGWGTKLVQSVWPF